jgi:para-aminobenzoate synthetase component 1
MAWHPARQHFHFNGRCHARRDRRTPFRYHRPVSPRRTIQELPWRCSPLDVLAAWPPEQPLVALVSGRRRPGRARWSILATPRERHRLTASNLGHEPLADLDRIIAASGCAADVDDRVPALAGGWIGCLAYELGAVIEPAARGAGVARSPAPDAWPLIELAWCPDAVVYDHATARWYAVGKNRAGHGFPTRGPGAREVSGGNRARHGFSASTPASDETPDRYLAMVSRTLDYIAAGDVFQANISHRLRSSFAGSTRALAVRALAASRPWYGAYLELEDGRCAISMSPELFLEADMTSGHVVTRPVKGTRPASASAADLLDSPKDAAELNMIVDLCRNDLGRVCRYGSVRVSQPRTIESHPTVHHGVAEVSGHLREGVGVGGLLKATFPAGSITGAPKIRAMQIIDELEISPRGPYCGAVGYISPERLFLNVAIRTLAIHGRRLAGRWDRLEEATLVYGTGGGIVADSDPLSEYRETLDKAAVLRACLAERASSDHLPTAT